METVLSRVAPEDKSASPFPHAHKHGAIDDGLCSRLIDEFPELDLVTRGKADRNNERFNYSANEVLAERRISELWREFVAEHVSQTFLDQALNLFADEIRATYPWFEDEFGALDKLRAGTRRTDSFENADILLDAQISVNTPVTAVATSVRRGHLDANNKLFVGLFYLRLPGDDSTGGDLELYRYARDRPKFVGTELVSAIDDRQLELAETIPYERNSLVFFLNSFQALHGVTERNLTSHPRLFMNIVAEVPRPLFRVPIRLGHARRLGRVVRGLVQSRVAS